MGGAHDMAKWLEGCQWVRLSSHTSDGLTITTLGTIDEDHKSQATLQVVSDTDGRVVSAQWRNTWKFGGDHAF